MLDFSAYNEFQNATLKNNVLSYNFISLDIFLTGQIIIEYIMNMKLIIEYDDRDNIRKYILKKQK